MERITYAFPKRKDIDPSIYIDAYNLILQCSQPNSPRGFVIRFLELMKRACPYDQAMVLFLDINGKVSGRYTVGIRDEWVDLYLNYYLYSEEYPQEIHLYQDIRECSDCNFSRIYDWSQFAKSEFITDYIQARGLRYSWGFCFFDLNGAYRVIISLDRTRSEPFPDSERARLEMALPILNNMYRNFYYQGMDTNREMQSPWSGFHLTKRETEIADLLCQGMTVQNISNVLYIAVTTTYKHISNIYQKVGVSSQQELLVKMLNRKDTKKAGL